MILFDDFVREYLGPARHAEPFYTFLNRSARPATAAVRQLLESWFANYPHEEQPDLRGRFRSTNNRKHKAAFFELFLHELLLRLRCQIEIHPLLVNTSKRPDF